MNVYKYFHTFCSRSLLTLFLESNYDVSLRINQCTPDEDLIFMSDAKIFIVGGGGYSNIIARIVKHRGGTVIQIPQT